MCHSLPPLICGRAKILILGSFPSPLSREKGEYYGNPRNNFWKIIFDTFGVVFNAPSYDDKQNLLFGNSLALWDVITSCDIVGALDSAIKNPVYNTALPEFVRKNKIQTVLFNGTKAYELYRCGIGTIEKRVLPSTSPANTRLSYDEKLKVWSEAVRI